MLALILASLLAGGSGLDRDLEDMALLERLNGSLLASRSATMTLEAWCGSQGLAASPKVTARRIRGEDKAPDSDTLKRLGVQDASALGYRRVELSCGGKVLSEADNWYVRAALTSEMNRQLDETDTPFGKVVAPLQPSRRTLAVERLWSPLPEDFAVRAQPPPPAPPRPHLLFRHRAVLTAASGAPLAEVIETYTEETLDFPRRR